MNNFENIWLIVGIAALIGFILFVLVFARYAGLYIQCVMTRAGITFTNLVMMSFRKVNPSVIVRSKSSGSRSSPTIDLRSKVQPSVRLAERNSAMLEIQVIWTTANQIHVTSREVPPRARPRSLSMPAATP